LTFIQAKPAPDRRTLTQLGYRVGRNREPARRIRAAGIVPVEEATEIAYRKKLHAFLTYMEAKKKESVPPLTADSKNKRIKPEDKNQKIFGGIKGTQGKIDDILAISSQQEKRQKID